MNVKNKLMVVFFGLTVVLSGATESFSQSASVRTCQREISRRVRADLGNRVKISFNRDMLPAPTFRDRELLRGAGTISRRNTNKTENFTYECEIGLNQRILTASYSTVEGGGNNSGGYVPPGNSYDNEADVIYRVHLANYGWTNWFTNGDQAGTTGQGRQMESIRIETPNLKNCDLRYRVHVQDFGWSNWYSERQEAGTTGQNRRLEAIEIDAGNCKRYDIEYRVHLAEYGWSEWTPGGRVAGTTGQNRAIEAVMIRASRR